MFSCKTAGLWNLLTVCPDSGTSHRPEKGVCRVLDLAKHRGEGLPFQVEKASKKAPSI